MGLKPVCASCPWPTPRGRDAAHFSLWNVCVPFQELLRDQIDIFFAVYFLTGRHGAQDHVAFGTSVRCIHAVGFPTNPQPHPMALCNQLHLEHPYWIQRSICFRFFYHSPKLPDWHQLDWWIPASLAGIQLGSYLQRHLGKPQLLLSHPFGRHSVYRYVYPSTLLSLYAPINIGKLYRE